MSQLQPTRKLMNILYACAHGRLPWGVDWDTSIPLCDADSADPEYILCCGHTLKSPAESVPVIAAGLMVPGKPDHFGRPTLTISKLGREYLLKHMDLVELEPESNAA